MSGTAPILELLGARPGTIASRLPPVQLDLQLMPGQCAMVEARDPAQAAEFADLCCGLLPLLQGSVRFLGRDWAEATDEHASAMRGRIGRVYGAGAWISFLGTDVNILLSQLHHTRQLESVLIESAAELSYKFGLPGLPQTRPGALAAADLARAACVRAFVGEPMLLLLERPEQGQFADLVPPLLSALTAAHDRHAASIWLTCGDAVWHDPNFSATKRLRLLDRGLIPVRPPA